VELFWNNTAMALARYPNPAPNGTWQWMNVVNATGALGSSFTLGDPRPLRWTKETDPWLHGFWSYDWADRCLLRPFGCWDACCGLYTTPHIPFRKGYPKPRKCWRCRCVCLLSMCAWWPYTRANVLAGVRVQVGVWVVSRVLGGEQGVGCNLF
jgi:hypothetical protein